MNVPCITEPTSIRNWVTFCGFFIMKKITNFRNILYQSWNSERGQISYGEIAGILNRGIE